MAKKTVVVDDLDDDLELVDDDEAEEVEEPVKKKSKKTASKSAPAEKAPKDTSGQMGASWLAEHVNDILDTNYGAAQMRVILRKLANDGEIEREVGTDRARYSFTGENDKTVKAVLKRVRAGEVESAKAERMTAAKSGTKKTKAVAEDDDELEAAPVKRKKKVAVEEVEAPAPKKATRKRSA